MEDILQNIENFQKNLLINYCQIGGRPLTKEQIQKFTRDLREDTFTKIAYYDVFYGKMYSVNL